MFENKERIIEIVGQALQKGNPNSLIMGYGCLNKITIHRLDNTKVKTEIQDIDIKCLISKTNLMNDKLDALIDYLGLEYKQKNYVMVKKGKGKKNGK